MLVALPLAAWCAMEAPLPWVGADSSSHIASPTTTTTQRGAARVSPVNDWPALARAREALHKKFERQKLEQQKREQKKRDAIAQLVAIQQQLLARKAQRTAQWDALARCESAGNWSVVDQYGGGLGIYIGTWHAFGGDEFASNPGYATKDQQIIVAERIYARFGFSGWGCARNMGWVR